MLALASSLTYSDPLKDERYVTTVKRDGNGQIIRRADVIAAFKKIHPCPSTGKSVGACKGWHINHVIPLACGGVDAVSNMAWQPAVVKMCWQDWCQDRFERKVYAPLTPIEGVDKKICKNEIVIINDRVTIPAK